MDRSIIYYGLAAILLGMAGGLPLGYYVGSECNGTTRVIVAALCLGSFALTMLWLRTMFPQLEGPDLRANSTDYLKGNGQ